MVSRKIRFAVLALSFAIAKAALCACPSAYWNQKWFESDSVHVAAGDLDGDTIAEIISTSPTAVSFRRASNLTPVPLYVSTALGPTVVADVNRDGHLDLVIADRGSSRIAVLPGHGDATFGAPILTSLATPPSRLLVGNFTGNASPDLAWIGESAASLIILRGNGSGSFVAEGTIAVAPAPLQLASADFDSDGYDDVAISHDGSNTLEVVFPNGSGGASAIVSLGSAGSSAGLATGDLDGDGDPDLVAASALPSQIHMIPYNGGRTFGTGSSHLFATPGAPRSLAVADLEGDADLDVVVTGPGYVLEFRQKDAQLEEGGQTLLFPYDRTGNAASAAAADFTGDGLVDLVVENTSAGGAELLINTCSPTFVNLSGASLISVGQTLRLTVTVFPIVQTVSPTGMVTLKWSGHEQTTTLFPTPSFGIAIFDVSALPLGFHEFVVTYAGDSNHPPGESTFYSRVITDTTETTLNGPTAWTYGEAPAFIASVTSSTGDTPVGKIDFSVDNARRKIVDAPAGLWNASFVKAGSHTISAKFFNSVSHPPSSDSIAVNVAKATSSIGLSFGSMSRAGQTAWIVGSVSAQFGGVLTGTTRLMEGSTTLLTNPANPDWPPNLEFIVSGLTEGTHLLRLVYEGDANVQGSSLDFVHTVVGASPIFPLVATGGGASVRLDFVRPAIGGSINVYRRTAGNALMFIGPISSPVYTDSAVVPGTAYQYQLQAITTEGVVTLSNIETVYVGEFTDATLAGATIKRVHFTEWLAALNAYRQIAGLGPMTLAFTGPVRASHLIQLRAGIDEARGALGLGSLVFEDQPLAGATPIRALHLQQLRDALR